MKKWEHKVIGINNNPEQMTELLNKFGGEEGWELVNIIPRGPPGQNLAIFKREIPKPKTVGETLGLPG